MIKPWQQITREFQRRIVIVDLIKHLTTLSLGALALIAVFLQSLIELGNNNIELIVVVSSFLICIVTSVISCVLMVKYIHIDNTSIVIARFITAFIWTSIITFITAVLVFAKFILSNIG